MIANRWLSSCEALPCTCPPAGPCLAGTSMLIGFRLSASTGVEALPYGECFFFLDSALVRTVLGPFERGSSVVHLPWERLSVLFFLCSWSYSTVARFFFFFLIGGPAILRLSPSLAHLSACLGAVTDRRGVGRCMSVVACFFFFFFIVCPAILRLSPSLAHFLAPSVPIHPWPIFLPLDQSCSVSPLLWGPTPSIRLHPWPIFSLLDRSCSVSDCSASSFSSFPRMVMPYEYAEKFFFFFFFRCVRDLESNSSC
jgi:hypothetical protein